jgi:D-3-phosphoglycerate dehydrogenase
VKTIIVTKPEHEKGLEVFQSLRPGYEIVTSDSDEESLAVAISSTGAKATIVGTDKYQGRLYEALSSNGIISRFGVGTDGINFRKIAKHGLLLANTPHSTDDSVAELAMWLIGDLARMVNYLDKQVRANSFSGETGREIKGKHLGIIGFGSIGKKVARIASYGFNMRVHGFGRSSKKEIENRYRMPIDEFNRLFGLESYTNNIEEILPKCDFVSCHLPLTEHTQGFFNKRLFSQFKKDAYFVNTSRGGIVDEVALNEVLGPGQIKGAALDVYNKEPYAPEKGQKDLRLWNRVVLTPHIASDTKEANTRMARVALDNIYHFFDGEFDEIKRVL